MKSAMVMSLLILAWSSINSTPVFAAGDCSDYTDLSGGNLPMVVTGTTNGATGDYGPFTEQPACWQGTWDAACANSGDVTYKWTAPVDGRFTFTLIGSASYADLLIYDFTCPAEPLYPEEYICGSHRSMLDSGAIRELELAAGQEILIVVDGWLVWNGDFTLTIYDNTTVSDSIAMGVELYHYPGLSTFAAGRNGCRWHENVGLADIEGELPVSDDHLFTIWSTSKAVTGTALMQLWEDGHFGLDDDVAEYVPFPVRHPAYPEIPITFRMLLSHVGGIKDNGPVLSSLVVEGGNDSPITPCEMMAGYFTPGGAYYSETDNFTSGEPGTVWQYSNIDVTLIGCLVEQINPDSLTFEDYCRTHIFDPLQMPTASYLLANTSLDDHVTHYLWNDPTYYPQAIATAPWYPAAGLRTNAHELSRFLLAYVQNGELYGQRILEAATIDTMLTIHFPNVDSGDIGQGLIWRYGQIGERWFWGHGGGGDGGQAICEFRFSRDLGFGAIAMANCGGSAGYDGINDILDMLLRHAEECAETGVAVPDDPVATPTVAQLSPCFPNPFNPQTTISLRFDRDLDAQVAVYDLAGKLVAVLAERHFSSGEHHLQWSGKGHADQTLPTGIYVVRLKTEQGIEARKVTLVQ